MKPFDKLRVKNAINLRVEPVEALKTIAYILSSFCNKKIVCTSKKNAVI
jgi:hypothetical protein